ncbi:MAG TPA: NADH-quinone oxidoreductase subunit M [Solirubrobacterales bacterium]
MTETLLWAPLTLALVAALFPGRITGWVAAVGPLISLVIAVVFVAGFDPSGGLQHTVDASWIPALGVRYQLGVDGISLFLILLTTVLWFAATLWSAINPPDRPRLYFLMFGLAETAVLGAFLAQDLILFVLFFDLMLIPFYFLFGSWGQEHPGRPEEGEGPIRPQPATLKMFIYTLVGSLLMLAGAIATGILSADGGTPDFSIQHLAANPLGTGSQYWIFWFFAAAFLVKMPAFPLHGWMPDAYRVAPLPALAIFSGVLSKVGAYGFLRIVLPIFPAATSHFQEVILLVAVTSILYGSVMAFTQTSARLILGYSSMAQLGFITLGLFSLRPDGADGAVLQMVNHGLVVAPLMLIAVVLVARTGTDDITRMGGLAMRAPVLAALFLIATLALLAMPGSANFIGEFYILNGIFQAKIVYAFVAAIGIALAAYYALRLYQHAMHNRKPDGIESREIGLLDGTVIAGLVACIVALALWPGLILHRVDNSVSGQLSSTSSAPTQVAER